MITTPSPDIRYYSNWLDDKTATALLQNMLTLPWQTETLTMFGRAIVVPRKILWFADNQMNYRYAGQDHIGLDFPKCVLDLRIQLAHMHCEVNSCLANYYANGEQYMGWHSDAEPCLGEQPVIASISLGAQRDFYFKHKQSKQVYKMQLGHGDLLIMQGETQKEWLHALPKRKRVTKPRVNLTFRKIVA